MLRLGKMMRMMVVGRESIGLLNELLKVICVTDIGRSCIVEVMILEGRSVYWGGSNLKSQIS